MALFDITSANATAVIRFEEVYPSGIYLQMFAVDTAISLEESDITETRIGVDGYMVAGYTPQIFPVTVNLEAASPSFTALATVWNYMRTRRTIYDTTLTITAPSIRRAFTFSTGVMKSGVPFSGLSTILDPTSWVFHFQNLDHARL